MWSEVFTQMARSADLSVKVRRCSCRPGCYATVAKAVKADVAPVGEAWARTLASRAHPHPTIAGTYLAACVLYASIFGRALEQPADGPPRRNCALRKRTADAQGDPTHGSQHGRRSPTEGSTSCCTSRTTCRRRGDAAARHRRRRLRRRDRRYGFHERGGPDGIRRVGHLQRARRWCRRLVRELGRRARQPHPVGLRRAVARPAPRTPGRGEHAHRSSRHRSRRDARADGLRPEPRHDHRR
jgi:hypothetical protein